MKRLEVTLQSLTELAAGELEAWELKAMRDPRNWVRPAVAVLVGGAAGAALVILRARHGARAHAGGPGGALGTARRVSERTLKDIERQARRLLGDR